MEVEKSLILTTVETHARQYIPERVPERYVYHDLQHTLNVVNSSREIAGYYPLSEEERESLEIAAWFHDIGYDEGPEGHEARSAAQARSFLSEREFPEERIQRIEACILATKMPTQPQSLLEEILCDADLNHLGKKSYWERCSRVRQELVTVRNIVMSDAEWVDFELKFLHQHHFYTAAAKALYSKRKQKHIQQLMKQKARLNPDSPLSALPPIEVLEKGKKKKKKNKSLRKGELNQLNLGRGVGAVYRTTYRTHVNLSSIADNKANIMLSINAIVISITLSSLVPRFGSTPHLIAPTILLLAVCLMAMIFATLSTRPKITEGKFTREDIEQKRSNLLFFGNFYNMSLDDFHWGMMEMIKDSDFLYSSMTRDLYFLGIVLAKKYRYLRICYGIFMYGLIASVAAFALVYFLK